jgi:hypothetical protein
LLRCSAAIVGDAVEDLAGGEAQRLVQEHLEALEGGAQVIYPDMAAFLKLVQEQLPAGRRLQVTLFSPRAPDGYRLLEQPEVGGEVVEVRVAHVWSGWMGAQGAGQALLPAQVHVNHFAAVVPGQAAVPGAGAAAMAPVATAAVGRAVRQLEGGRTAPAPAAGGGAKRKSGMAVGPLSRRPPKAVRRPGGVLTTAGGPAAAAGKAAGQAVQRNRGRLAGAASVLPSSSPGSNSSRQA